MTLRRSAAKAHRAVHNAGDVCTLCSTGVFCCYNIDDGGAVRLGRARCSQFRDLRLRAMVAAEQLLRQTQRARMGSSVFLTRPPTAAAVVHWCAVPVAGTMRAVKLKQRQKENVADGVAKVAKGASATVHARVSECPELRKIRDKNPAWSNERAKQNEGVTEEQRGKYSEWTI